MQKRRLASITSNFAIHHCCWIVQHAVSAMTADIAHWTIQQQHSEVKFIQNGELPVAQYLYILAKFDMGI